MNITKWEPLPQNKLDEIVSLFKTVYPENTYDNLAERISDYWIELLHASWNKKSEELKKLDLSYNPSDRLSRVRQNTTVIAYADSISRTGEKSLVTLDHFFKKWFPAIGGLHILPACSIVEDRFNDGYFSQVERDNIHSAFGTNRQFADIMHRYFSMNDLVLGHVDIENPVFQEYLAGNDTAGRKFYTYTIEEYEKLKAAGSFDRIFRPRPFPLFTIFRRLPVEMPYRTCSHGNRIDVMIQLIRKETGVTADPRLINILWLFNRILNDQMLLDEDYRHIPKFIEWLGEKDIPAETIFTKSRTQEVQHYPYIFVPEIKQKRDLLVLCRFSEEDAEAVGRVFKQNNRRIFGEEIRALTTFSHVQVDVNTTTFEGLKALAEDLVWYLSMDLNMLRLDAVNYAFKKWGTSCFGLPELDMLMKIIYLSMECISPRIIPNLEVNDSLTTILSQLSAKAAAPPMMHDFHLASLLPAVFHLKNPKILGRIFDKIKEFDIPKDSIRFSLSESHDGKSVRGSLDLLTFEERRVLTKAVIANGGYVKYKSIPPGESSEKDFKSLCGETGLDCSAAIGTIFNFPDSAGRLMMKDSFDDTDDVLELLSGLSTKTRPAARFFFERLISGRDPYELCITTRNSLPVLEDKDLEIKRFLAFETLAFAVMGRNVKTIYFNDLLALPNDYERVEQTGELRNIKRTKTDYDKLLPKLEDSGSFEARVARGINNLIALTDSDPALHFRGNEAGVVSLPDGLPVAAVVNNCGADRNLIIINIDEREAAVKLPLEKAGFEGLSELHENIGSKKILLTGDVLEYRLGPFERLWLTAKAVQVHAKKLV